MKLSLMPWNAVPSGPVDKNKAYCDSGGLPPRQSNEKKTGKGPFGKKLTFYPAGHATGCGLKGCALCISLCITLCFCTLIQA